MSKIITVIFIIIFCIDANAQQLTGRDVMIKVDNRPDGDNRSSMMKMTLENKRGRKRIRSMKSYSMDIGKDKKSIMFFQAPADVKNTAFLTWNYDDPNRDDDRWLYLPAMKKTRRISGSSAKTDYFMGSDFTYDDMGGNRNVDEDTHSLLREENYKGDDCWVIKSVPKDNKELYSKKISWIRKSCLYAHKVEYYDKMGKLMKTLTISGVRKIGDYWSAHKLEMVNHQKQHTTILEISDIKYNISLQEDKFVVSNLERGLF